MKNGQLIHSGSLEQIITVIENKVWECTVRNDTAVMLMQKYPVINIRQEKEAIFLRLVSKDKPCNNAVNVGVTLEDLYLYYFSEENKNE